MGQKINPIGFRLAVNKNWSSRWYANTKNFAPMLAEDIKVRDFLKGKLAHASVGRVLIERPAKDARITIFSARPGVVIGKKGEEIESLKSELRRIMGVNQVHVNIEEIRKPVIGIKVWVYKGEVMPKGEVQAGLAPATAPIAQPEQPSEPKRAKKPAPRAGACRAPAKPRADGERRARKPDAPAPRTTIKKPKKIVKDDAGGETKE